MPPKRRGHLSGQDSTETSDPFRSGILDIYRGANTPNLITKSLHFASIPRVGARLPRYSSHGVESSLSGENKLSWIGCLLSCWLGDIYGWAGANICRYFSAGEVKQDF